MEFVGDLFSKVSTAGSFLVYKINEYVNYYTDATNIERHKDYYIVTYNYGGQIYKLKCSQGKKKVHIIKITGILLPSDKEEPPTEDSTEEGSSDEVDLTDEILPYMGPRMDFHNLKLSPKDFNCSQITFYLLNNNQKTFYEFDTFTF